MAAVSRRHEESCRPWLTPRRAHRDIWRTYFRMHTSSPACELVLVRDESEDYWLGAYMFNLVAAELAGVR